MLERALVGGDGGKYLGLARREREAAGEILKACLGVDSCIVRGRRGVGCCVLRGFRCMLGDCRLSMHFVLGGGCSIAGGRHALIDRCLTRRVAAGGTGHADLLPSASCDFATPWAWI